MALARLLLATLAALAALVSLGWSSLAAPGAETQDVPPGRFIEHNLELAEGARVPWSILIEPREELAVYDIHTHNASGEVWTLEAGLVNGTAESLFVAPETRTFSWLVENAIARRTLRITIETEQVAQGPSRTMPAWEPVVLALAALLALGLRRPRLGAALPLGSGLRASREPGIRGAGATPRR